MIETPCKQECLYNPTLGHCEACGRTLEDLQLWTSMTRDERRAAMKAAKERLRGSENRKGRGVPAV